MNNILQDKFTWISIGENCLTQGVLNRHRITVKSDFSAILRKLETFYKFYKKPSRHCLIILFYQTLISDPSERRVVKALRQKNILEFNFFTSHLWEGNDEELFWGIVDGDLIEIMIQEIDRHADAIFNPESI